MNRLEGKIEAVEGSSGILSVRVSTPAGRLEALVFGLPGETRWIARDSRVRASFKESDVLVAPRGAFPWSGALPGTVARATDSDILARLDLLCGPAPIAALVPVRRIAAMAIPEGSEIDAWVPPHEVTLEEIVP